MYSTTEYRYSGLAHTHFSIGFNDDYCAIVYNFFNFNDSPFECSAGDDGVFVENH